jgi:hypothetical protein
LRDDTTRRVLHFLCKMQAWSGFCRSFWRVTVISLILVLCLSFTQQSGWIGIETVWFSTRARECPTAYEKLREPHESRGIDTDQHLAFAQKKLPTAYVGKQTLSLLVPTFECDGTKSRDATALSSCRFLFFMLSIPADSYLHLYALAQVLVFFINSASSTVLDAPHAQ